MLKLVDHFVMAIAAPRGSGKSHLIRAMLMAPVFLRYDHIIVMSPSLDFNEDYDLFRNDKRFVFITDVSGEKLEMLWDKQARAQEAVVANRREIKANGGAERVIRTPLTLLILDDIIDSNVITFRGGFDKIAERGRHIGLSAILTSQRISAISRSVRINSDYFLVFKPFNISEGEQFLDQYVSRTKHKRQRARDLFATIFEDEFRFIIIDNGRGDRKVTQLRTSTCGSFIKGEIKNINLDPTDYDDDDESDEASSDDEVAVSTDEESRKRQPICSDGDDDHPTKKTKTELFN